MQRRKFIHYSFIIAAGSYLGAACRTKSTPITEGNSDTLFELDELTIDELQKGMIGGKYSSERLTSLYLQRIADIDKKGPNINSVIELNPDAIAIAKAMDEERKNGKSRGPLHGIPVLLKDNIDTADKMMTTAGSLALNGNIAAEDAFIVKGLRNAGAVILGKTNLSEWANFRSTRSVSGWSSRGGQTRNPYVLDRSPCGSSSGSAVAVAANLCVVSVGTETDGSIACPASMNGIVGIKPTVGLVSRAGVIPISKTQDTAGPFARTVKDAAALLSVLAGTDDNDPVTLESRGKGSGNYAANLNSDALKGKRIGIEKSFLKKHEAIDLQLSRALEQIKSKGATVVEVEFMKSNNEIGADEFKVLLYEFKDGLDKYLSTANGNVKSLGDVIRFNKQHEAKVMPYFKQEIMDSAQVKGGLQAKEYTDALKRTMTMRTVLTKMMDENKLDALCAPANGASWCIDFVNGDAWTGYGGYGPAAVAGFPSVTVPMGFVNGLPIGLSFIGRAYDEAGVIGIAYAYEQASMNRRKPTFKKTLV